VTRAKKAIIKNQMTQAAKLSHQASLPSV
jgi:hypothetical protein